MSHTDRELVLLYAEWSEEIWAASWRSPYQSRVRDFKAWLDQHDINIPLEDDELALVAEFRELEANDG